MLYGYARVSTDGQSVDAQVKQLRAAGAEKIFKETASGAKTDRGQLLRALDHLGKLLAETWSAMRSRRVSPGNYGQLWSAAFSPDGKRIVTASNDETARVWDAESMEPIGKPLKGHEDAVQSAAFSPDGQRIVTASADGTARVWDADSGSPIGEPLKGHLPAVSSAAFSPDGKSIVTVSLDQTARVWDIFIDIEAVVAKAKVRRLALPDTRGAQGVLPAPRAAGLVHRDGEAALPHARMETVARRQARWQDPAAPRGAFARRRTTDALD
jgi:dipeptidyl aminopeptidase/acylaminoacyl peptidase